MLAIRTLFEGGGGPGPNIIKKIAIITCVVIAAKYIWSPPPENSGGFYNKPKLIAH